MDTDRFWAKVKRGDREGCWEWLGARAHYGHGVFKVDGRTQLAHRLAWILTRGEIPDGMCVCHSCDNPPCCNPDHLFLGSRAANLRDAARKCRLPAARLSDELAGSIRAEYRRGRITQQALADRYGVSRQVVNEVLSGKRWKQV